MLLLNVTILVLVVCILIKHTWRKFKDTTDKDYSAKKTLRTVINTVGMMILFGLTWFFGALTFKEDSVAFQYLFCICNSSLGVFIFMMYCVLAGDTKNLWLQTLGCKKTAPRGIPSTTAMEDKQSSPSIHADTYITDATLCLLRIRNMERQSQGSKERGLKELHTAVDISTEVT